MKDLLDGIGDLGYINKDNYEYICAACGYCGDSCDYDVIEIDDEDYPVGDPKYVEKCPICGENFNI